MAEYRGIKSSVLLVSLSMLLMSVLRVWQQLPGVISLNEIRFFFSKYHTCENGKYTVELLSISPLIIYINGFLTETEVRYLLELSKHDFEPSLVYDENLNSVIDTRFRTSQSAMMPWKDTVSLCLSQRLKSLLGNFQHIETEPIQIVKYEPGQEFHVHMDWFDKPRNRTYNPAVPYRPYNRFASVFAYLDDTCTGGETYFPHVQGVSNLADGDKFARTESGDGLVVKPKRGNAIFWNNLLPNGTGDPRVAHAGLPVHTGRKIGINLFSHYYLDSPMVGGDEE